MSEPVAHTAQRHRRTSKRAEQEQAGPKNGLAAVMPLIQDSRAGETDQSVVLEVRSAAPPGVGGVIGKGREKTALGARKVLFPDWLLATQRHFTACKLYLDLLKKQGTEQSVS